MLFTLLLAPCLLAGYAMVQRRRQAARNALTAFGAPRDAAGRSLGNRRHIPTAFLLTGLTFLFLSTARPVMNISLPRVEGTVILVFDVSTSMRADDLAPTRMDAAKAAARAFVEKQPATIRIGIVAFSNGGLIIHPPSHDPTEVLEAIDRLSPEGGTSLGQGIFTALNAIAGSPIALDPEAFEEGIPALELEAFPSAALVLLTDGENTNPPDPLDVAELAAQSGVRIYPVGIGSEQGAVIEVDGFNLVTQLNRPMLEEIAMATNGVYYHAEDEDELREIYQNIDLQLTVRGEEMEVTAVVAGISYCLLLLGAALSLTWMGRAI